VNTTTARPPRRSTRRSWQLVVAAIAAMSFIGTAGLVAYAVTGGGEPKHTPTADPDADLPDDQRMAADAQTFQDFMARRAAWIAEFDAQHRDVTTLSVSETTALSLPGKATLPNAVAAADMVIEGFVSNLHFTPQGTITTIDLTAQLKPGSSTIASTIDVLVPGGPEPDPDFSTGYLATYPGVPFLRPEQHVILFLQSRHSQGAPPPFSIQPVTGEYVIDDHGVRTVAGNPFSAAVAGRSVASFRSQLLAALSKN
jgi:hypothetical protein